MLQRLKRLRKLGVLGLNSRNALYTARYNPRHLYPLVDDKLQTKTLAVSAGLAVPDLYGVVEIEHQIADLARLLHGHDDFVIKPAHGSSGDGVLVIKERSKNMYQLANGLTLDQGAFDYYVSNILGGLYSLGGHPDKALIEYRVQSDEIFAPVTFAGVPDIRIIVFLGVPAMAMLRLPTRRSGGKANLHQGAAGAGLDMARGLTLNGVIDDRIISEHPDTGFAIADLQVPHWRTLLEIAARCYDLTGLGYIGVDIVLDARKGPLVLEINARPGLAIQIANRCGILPRLELIERQIASLTKLTDRVNFAQSSFPA